LHSAIGRLSLVVEYMLELISHYTELKKLTLLGGSLSKEPSGMYHIVSVHYGKMVGPAPLKFSNFESD
jgi:hypothetical protein